MGMDNLLVEGALILLVGYLLIQKYRQTKMVEYVVSAILLGASYVAYYLTGSKISIYFCFLLLAYLFLRIWKAGPRS